MVADGRATAELAEIEGRVSPSCGRSCCQPAPTVDAATALLSDEGLDSISALRLAQFVAGSFGITMRRRTSSSRTSETVAAIASFVSRARARGAPDSSAR